ncbi:MAG: carbamate kinase [Thermoplasmata archaeon]|nr:carbamate kinase [Thermoplasmata archaeon]MCI4344955.1 carbamate kinase [Thermoplasmata archaeon]
MPRTVVALGGNALTKPGGEHDWAEAVERMRLTAGSLAQVVKDGHELVVTHGNGPQVGAALRQNEIAEREVPARPLAILNAETEGQLGLLIAQELAPALRRAGVPRTVLAMVTLVEVRPGDRAFKRPTKPIGRFYTEAEARLFRKRASWAMSFDGARGGWRRLVPSPVPVAWVEGEAVRRLFDAGIGRQVVLVAGGGGGVPVVRRRDGRLEPVDAVVDKDLTSALIAEVVGAETLVIVTDVPAVAVGFQKSWERWLGEVTSRELGRLLAQGEFGAGSMAPKVEAALQFLRRGGRRVIITDIPSLRRGLRGEAGTRISAR